MPRDHLDQGSYGAGTTKKSGSKLEQGPWGASKTRASGSQFEQGEGGARSAKQSGSHLDQQPGIGTDMTAEKQGGTRFGHDRTDPNLGKGKSGSKFDQNPNNKLTKKR